MALNLGVTSCQSLEISLDQFVRGEVLEGSNAYYCEKCKEKVCNALHAVILLHCTIMCTYYCVCYFYCTEDHSEEDMYKILAQCSLYPPHALWLRLGKWTLYQI